MLVAWGVTLEGRKVLLGLQLGSRESYEAWLSLRPRPDRPRHERARAVCADGAPGLWKAVRELWPHAGEQRCTVHALRNVTSKLPERHHTEVKARWWKRSTRPARRPRPDASWRRSSPTTGPAYPSAMAVIERDLDVLVTHLRWPSEHRKRIRTTNLLERTFVEVRRRTKVIGRFPGETSSAVADLGRARTLKPRLARRDHDPEDRRRDRTHPTTAKHIHPHRHPGGRRRLTSPASGAAPTHFHPEMGRHR